MTFWQRFRFAWRFAKKWEEAARFRLPTYEERVEFFRSEYGDGKALERRVLAAQCTCLTMSPVEVIEWDPECAVHLAYADDLTNDERREIDSIGSSNT